MPPKKEAECHYHKKRQWPTEGLIYYTVVLWEIMAAGAQAWSRGCRREARLGWLVPTRSRLRGHVSEPCWMPAGIQQQWPWCFVPPCCGTGAEDLI